MIHFKVEIKMPIKGSQNKYNIYLFGWLIYTCLYSKMDRVYTNIEDSFSPRLQTYFEDSVFSCKVLEALTSVQQESQASQKSSVPEYCAREITLSPLVVTNDRANHRFFHRAICLVTNLRIDLSQNIARA